MCGLVICCRRSNNVRIRRVSFSTCSAIICGARPKGRILTAAYRAGVPIFCPAIADSSIGMGLLKPAQTSWLRLHRYHRRHRRIGKPCDSAAPDRGDRRSWRRHSEKLHQSGKRTAEFFSSAVGGHKYALQIVTDVPTSGSIRSTLEEAKIAGKLATDALLR